MTGHHPLADDSEDFYAQLQQPQSGAASAASGTPGAAQQPTSLGDGIEDLRQLAKRVRLMHQDGIAVLPHQNTARKIQHRCICAHAALAHLAVGNARAALALP